MCRESEFFSVQSHVSWLVNLTPPHFPSYDLIKTFGPLGGGSSGGGVLVD